MNKTKIYFCLFLLTISFIYLYGKIKTINLYDVAFNKNVSSIANVNSNLKASNLLSKDDDTKPVNINIEKSREELSSKPIVYIYNTHQTEEFKASKNYKPTVVTASKVIEKTLKKDGILSLVESRSIKKKLDEYGYDYSGTYTVSFEYLTDRKKSNPSLKYYFDIHRDSITGPNSKVKINGKNYATMMFLVGQNHKKYKSNVANLKVMEKYLNQNYSGLVRNTYYQPKYSYNQEYDPNMFLVEIGGPENTLEEITNTSVALGHAISSYVENSYEE